MFLCCIFSYATKPIAVDRVKSVAFNYNNKWTAESEFNALILTFKDRIVIKSGKRESLFTIAGKVEEIKDANGTEWVTFECLNENLESCVLGFTYSKYLDSRCMLIMYPNNLARYIIKNEDEH